MALCGFLLLSLGVIEQRPDFSWMDSDFAAVAAQAGEFVPSLIGAALMVLAAALAQRVNLAWSVTLILLVVGAAFTLAQEEPLWIPGVLVLAAGLVAPYRRAFYRHARILADPLQPASALSLLALILCVLALAVFERHVRWLSRNSFWEVILSRDVANSMRASVALTVALGLAALWRLLRPRQVSWAPWNAAQRLRYAALGADPPDEADGVVWGEAGRAAMPFRRVRPHLARAGRPRRVGRRSGLGDLAPARPRAARRPQPGGLARRAQPAARLRRSRPGRTAPRCERPAARRRRGALAGRAVPRLPGRA